jgi:hypothetical protein
MFSRPDQEQRTLTFNAGGAELAYHELSGGEREVAFLVGQLLRFRLTRGLLLVDEPELHLNAELLERWLAWVQDSIADGQVWLATHSLEAVEAAGPENALVLERASDGQVRSINRLSDRPVISTLSGALGAPAFSLDRQRFVLIEGERPGRERRRFASLCPGVANLYLEAGNCNQVVSKLKLVSEFAQESDRLHIGGVVDRDHWDARQRARMTQDAPVHVLGVHEIENFFLLPAALSIFSQRQGRSRETAPDLLRRACDQFAGLWIVQRAAIRHDVDLGPKVRTRGGALTWGAIEGREAETAEELRQLVDFVEPALVAKVEEWFIGAINAYAKVRYSETLWAECSGKQVAGTAAPLFGIASAADLEAQVLTLLKDGTVEPPPTLIALREYVQNISAAPAA